MKLTPAWIRCIALVCPYRQGLPLPLLADFIGHTSIVSTRICAYADTEMKRATLAKADPHGARTTPIEPLWEGHDGMILTLASLN